MPRPPAFIICGQPVSWGLWRLVLRVYCHGDEHFAGRVFYRGAMRNPKEIVPYIMRGLQPKGYMWDAHFDETTAPKDVRAWVDEHILSHLHGPGPRDPAPMRDALRDTLKAMLEGLI